MCDYLIIIVSFNSSAVLAPFVDTQIFSTLAVLLLSPFMSHKPFLHPLLRYNLSKQQDNRKVYFRANTHIKVIIRVEFWPSGCNGRVLA